jgi:hypothetical protein
MSRTFCVDEEASLHYPLFLSICLARSIVREQILSHLLVCFLHVDACLYEESVSFFYLFFSSLFFRLPVLISIQEGNLPNRDIFSIRIDKRQVDSTYRLRIRGGMYSITSNR